MDQDQDQDLDNDAVTSLSSAHFLIYFQLTEIETLPNQKKSNPYFPTRFHYITKKHY
jgi:hypothetical protein